MSRIIYTGGVQRLYTKVGNDVLRGWDGDLDLSQINHLATELSGIHKDGTEVVHVTSGGLTAGAARLGMDLGKERGKIENNVGRRQFIACAGMARLYMAYEQAFERHGIVSTQLLVTSDILNNPKRQRDFIRNYKMHVEMGSIPIVNNNDGASSKELGDYSENEELLGDVIGVLTTWDQKRGANTKSLVVILTKYQLHTGDPACNMYAEPVFEVHDIEEIRKYVAAGKERPAGDAKLDFTERVTREMGIPVVWVPGKYGPENNPILPRVLAGEEIGTFFYPKE